MSDRIRPFLLLLYPVAAIRLGLDFWDRDSGLTKVFGMYYASAALIIWLGLRRKWGFIRFWPMVGSLLLAAALTFGVCNTVAYAVGQFMEWQDGRYFPGTPILDAAGAVTGYQNDGGAAPLQDGAGMKLLMGLMHGVLTTLSGTVWMSLFAAAFLFVVKRPERTG